MKIQTENNQHESRETLLEKTKSHWDKLASEESKRDFTRLSWGSLGSVQSNHNYLTTHDPDYYWIDYLRDKYFKNGNAGHTLALGCGAGFIELLFKQRGFVFESITGVDLSEKCIETAKHQALAEGIAPKINYFTADLNRYTPSPKSYNFIFFFHSLHHIHALENILSGCARALLPDGILMVNEFVGPSRFQWTDSQLKAANEVFRIIPEDLRYDLQYHVIKQEITRPSVEEMMRHDPSEAVRSADIETILKKYFVILEEKNWGGTITNLLFANTAGNYDLQNPYHKALTELVIHHENILIANNILPSDFKFYVTKPNSNLLLEDKTDKESGEFDQTKQEPAGSDLPLKEGLEELSIKLDQTKLELEGMNLLLKKRGEKIASLNVSLKEKQSRILNLEAVLQSKVQELEGKIKERENALTLIRNSHGYKALWAYYSIRDKLLPVGTKRRAWIQNLFREILVPRRFYLRTLKKIIRG